MKFFNKKLIIALVAAASVASIGIAQDNSNGSVVRRRAGDRDRNSAQQAGVTSRMQQHFEGENLSDADMMWMRVIYRQLDLDNPANAPLYYPEDIVDGDENLFRIIMRLLAEGRIPAYEYLDGREIFNDENRINVKDMLDRFHIYYTDAKGSTERNPKFTIQEADVPTNEVLSYYILERWEFDTRSNRMKTRVEAICPVLHRSGDFGGDAIKYPMFWVKLDAISPYLAQQSIFIDDDNNLAKYTYDDFFAMNMYDGKIYKTRNLQNKSMMQLYPDPDDLERAQDSIQNRLENYDKKMWVPTREEVIAAREAREAAAAGDSIDIADRDKPKVTSRTSRSRTKPTRSKVVKAKAPKSSVSSGSSNAVRSVRRRK
ncbi:MAG: gliding motility protein GldN [Muribaculaceae bacterium]|nr:gliding motility protein GldN [Muribaculaceae bacterium]